MSLLRTAMRPAARLNLVAPFAATIRHMSFKPVYTAEATVVGARNGHVKTKSGSLDLKLDLPKEFGAKGGPGTNPEELFASGYAACFGGALNASAQELKIKLKSDTKITGRVHIGPKQPKGFQLGVELQVADSGISDADWDKVISNAHAICPYSHAVGKNIEVKTTKG
ncbi:hypothetical protein BG004_007436 [Podila humilis]|nr:hypothetical protein BG004_007436 [Podila humilis]